MSRKLGSVLVPIGAVLGFAITTFLMKRIPHQKDGKSEYSVFSFFGSKSNQLPAPPSATLLGMVIDDTCTCGQKVELFDVQMLVSKGGDHWFRMCETCIRNSKLQHLRPA